MILVYFLNSVCGLLYLDNKIPPALYLTYEFKVSFLAAAFDMCGWAILMNELYNKNNDWSHTLFTRNISNLSYKVGSCKHENNPGRRIQYLFQTMNKLK